MSQQAKYEVSNKRTLRIITLTFPQLAKLVDDHDLVKKIGFLQVNGTLEGEFIKIERVQ